MKQKKIAIVIDNPKRDLLSLGDVASKLVSKTVIVDLVPMYFLKQYIFGELPDLIIFNYARSSNSHLIQVANRLNIKTVVLDTEGGVWIDLDLYVQIVKTSGAPCLDLYMTWGQVQRDHLCEILPKIAKKIVVTGHPRFDRIVNSKSSVLEKNYVLINSNFSFVFPKYETFRNEFDFAKNPKSLGSENASDYFRNACITYGRFLEFISKLIESTPEIKFVIRSHPFEDDERYKAAFLNFNNVVVSSSGDVLHALENAICLIHFECTTAVEAYLRGVPAGSIEFCDFGQKRHTLPMILSDKLFSVNEAIEFIIKSKKISTAPPKRDQFNETLLSYFGPLDGMASNRIAEAVLSTVIFSENNSVKNLKFFKELFTHFLYKLFKFIPFYLLVLIKGGSKKRIAEKSFYSINLNTLDNTKIKFTDDSNFMNKFFKAPISVRVTWIGNKHNK